MSDPRFEPSTPAQHGPGEGHSPWPSLERERTASSVARPPRVAVVLAAGRAERLSKVTRGRSKALVLLGGMPLVERAVRTLFAAGVERVVVVSGHQAESLQEAAAHLPPDRVQVVHSSRWEKGNGVSLSSAEAAVAGEDRFLILCGDTVFSRGALSPLTQTAGPAVLADLSPARAAWEEGTRVQVEGGQAVAFGKALDAPAIDCGAFLVGPEVFDAQRRAEASGDFSLAGAITELTRTHPLWVVGLPPSAWWQDIDTPEDLRAARTRLRRSLANPTDGPISRRLNRPISTRLTMAFSPFRISPTLLSLIAFLVGIWAAWSLSAGRAIVGGLLAQANSVLDGMDGETARLHFRTSPSGARLDSTIDRMIDAAIIAGVGLWIWVDPSRTFRVSIILAAAAGWGVFAHLLQDRVSTFELPPSSERPLSLMLLGRDVRMFILAVGAVLGLPIVGLAVGFLTYCSSGILRVARVVRLGWNPFRRPSGAEELPGRML